MNFGLEILKFYDNSKVLGTLWIEFQFFQDLSKSLET